MTAAIRESVKFLNAALDEDPRGNIILRGVLSPESLYTLKVGPYQREVQPKAKIHELMKAFEHGSVPDIDLGMRGGSFTEREENIYLQDDCFIIDGLQRVTSARKLLETGGTPRLGAIVHFNTTEASERERFRILNTMHLRLSPNILIRNKENESEIIALLRFLCKDKAFPLYDKVSWNQRMNRNELLTAYTFLKATGYLQSRFGPTRTSTMSDLVVNLDNMYAKFGRSVLRDNIKTFWEFMDECYRIRYITFKEGAVFLKNGFLFVMATFFADHAEFWQDSKFHIDTDLKRKIATFPINDPEVIRLASATGQACAILYNMLTDHVNKGKREKRLIKSKKSYRTTPHGVLFEQENVPKKVLVDV